jgi:hypothetical protein
MPKLAPIVIFLYAIIFYNIKILINSLGSDDSSPNTIKVSESIESPTTWENRYVYVVSGFIDINSSLTIQPGTVVKFKNESGMNIRGEGIILAQGTPDASIVFTSYHDDEHGGDTNNDGNNPTNTQHG